MACYYCGDDGHDSECSLCHGTGHYTQKTSCTTCNGTGQLDEQTGKSLTVNTDTDGGKYIKFTFSNSTAKRSTSTIADLLSGKGLSGAVKMNITLTNVPSDLTLTDVELYDGN